MEAHVAQQAGAAVDHLPGLLSLLDEFRSISSHRHESLAPETQPLAPATSTGSAVETLPVEAAHTGLLTGNSHLTPTTSLQLPFLLSQELQLPFAFSQEAQQGPKPLEGPRSLEGVHNTGDVQLPTEHLQNAGQSLPCLATELMAAQSTQVDELQKRKERLQQLQTQLAREKDHLSSIERELFSTARAMCLSQDECAHLTQECSTLEKTVGDLVTEKNKMELKLKRVRDESGRSEEVFKAYREKMSKHEARTKVVESRLPLYKEMEGLESSIQALKTQRSEYIQGEGLRVLSGEKQLSLHEEIDVMLATLAGVQEETKEKKKKVEACEEKNEQIRREIEMKRKRHNAQMTRLKRQVSEAQSRKRQWTKEAERLQANIRQLRLKLEE